jgi:hypothetical protein
MTLKIEVGKFYRTRDGHKVGPMRNANYGDGFDWVYDGGSGCWSREGKQQNKHKPEGDLIAEWTDEPAPVKEVGTFAEIGAQVGDVVANKAYMSDTYFVCHGDEGLYACRDEFGRKRHGWNSSASGWRIIRRASDAKPAGPVITETVKRIVPGVYGRIGVGGAHNDCVWLWLTEANGDYDLMALLTAAEIRAAITTLTEIADALEGGAK